MPRSPLSDRPDASKNFFEQSIREVENEDDSNDSFFFSGESKDKEKEISFSVPSNVRSEVIRNDRKSKSSTSGK